MGSSIVLSMYFSTRYQYLVYTAGTSRYDRSTISIHRGYDPMGSYSWHWDACHGLYNLYDTYVYIYDQQIYHSRYQQISADIIHNIWIFLNYLCNLKILHINTSRYILNFYLSWPSAGSPSHSKCHNYIYILYSN